MPELDGPAVCRAVRKRTEQTYAYMVLLTSKDSKEETVVGLESGADQYLTKPFNVEELRARLRVGERILLLEDRLVEARESMRFRATHDPLTSLLNRGAILDLLNRELHRSQRENKSAAILLGDVDHFKRVNDSLGHLVGDEVLTEIARRLLGAVRSYDFVGRYGGEEFLVILNSCDTAYGPARGESTRKSVSKPIMTTKGPLTVTMSFGVLQSAEWGPLPPEELLHGADMALYEAKAAGRDCLRLAKPAVNPAQSTVPPELLRQGR
jgi:two-component system cell cycle response regulator